MSWKYTCPNGHTYGSIKVRHTQEKTYYCEKCEMAFSYMLNAKTGKRVDRSVK